MENQVELDALIIGGGVIGAAVAAVLSRRKPELSIALVEAGVRIAEGITSRNSGVIHAGIYYPPTSFKAQACIRGNKLLYEWAEKQHVAHRRVGKLIIARGAGQMDELTRLFENARNSGAPGVEMLSKSQAQNYCRELEYDAAIWSPETGIVDPYELTRSYLTDAEANGVMTQLNCPVTAIESLGGGRGYRVSAGDQKIDTSIVINAAGLYADEIASMAGAGSYRIYPWRGDYFTFKPSVEFNHLIYPVKERGAAGLGVHLTIDLAGMYRLGPDVQIASSKEDFEERSDKQADFEEAARRLLGPIPFTNVRYGTCGLRPKLRSPEEKEDKDFVVSEDLPGFVNLIGIESPGLTASLAIAEKVVGLLS